MYYSLAEDQNFGLELARAVSMVKRWTCLNLRLLLFVILVSLLPQVGLAGPTVEAVQCMACENETLIAPGKLTQSVSSSLKALSKFGSDLYVKMSEEYSSSQIIDSLLKIAQNEKGQVRASQGKCLHFVKKWAQRVGLIGESNTIYARDFGGDLENNGFFNLMSDSSFKSMSPCDAPKGAILVYEGGSTYRCGKNVPCGHVEIKTATAGQGGFISDYADNVPVTGLSCKDYPALKPSHKLIGVYVKPISKYLQNLSQR